MAGDQLDGAEDAAEGEGAGVEAGGEQGGLEGLLLAEEAEWGWEGFGGVDGDAAIVVGLDVPGARLEALGAAHDQVGPGLADGEAFHGCGLSVGHPW